MHSIIYVVMKRLRLLSIYALFVTVFVVSCGSRSGGVKQEQEESSTSATTMAAIYDYRIVAEYPHSSRSYTQGLEYRDGVMWEGTGREGRSHLQRIDLKSGAVDVVASLPDNEFGEGITHHQGCIYQLTWLNEKAYVYDLKGNILKTIPYKGEGWGLATDGTRLFFSDGTSVVRIVNPDTFETEGIISVTLNGMTLDLVNEMEWIEGKLWANIYLTDIIVEIDTATGKVTGFVDLEPLRDLLKNNPQAEALNGIAYNAKTKHFYVTGKDWNTLFELEIIK